MEITQVMKNDLHELAKIYTAEFVKLEIGENWTIERAEQMLNHLFEIQPDMAFVARENGVIIGGIFGIIKPWWDGNHLSEFELFVDSTHQGKKVGKRLLRHAIEVAVNKHNVSSIDGVAYTNHQFPLSWYIKMGFEVSENLLIVSADAKKTLATLN